MNFSSDAETVAAMVVTVRWLPELVRRVEKGVKALGAVIMKKAMLRFEDGTSCPTLFLRGSGGWYLELRLQNAFEDFLTIDRDEKPVRLDPRLLDDAFARKKLRDVVEGRLAMVRAFNRSRRPGDVVGHIQKLGARYGRYRIWREEGGEKP